MIWFFSKSREKSDEAARLALAQAKRRLERICRDVGVSQSQAVAIASKFFDSKAPDERK